jgi:hypothetical protein
MAIDCWRKKLSYDEIRRMHHEISRDFILKYHEVFGIHEGLVKTIADVVYSHPRRIKFDQILKEKEKLLEDLVRSKFLGAIFRVADVMDTDIRRAPEFKSKYVLSLPLRDQRHWKVCQLITGARYDLDEGRIVVDAGFTNQNERQLVIWKLNGLYDELERVMHIFSKNGMPYVDVIGDIVNHRTNKKEVVSTREMKGLSEKLKAEINTRATRLYRELHNYWINDKIELKKKIILSRRLFKKLFWEYGYFDFFETNSKYESLKRLYISQEHNVRYLENGISKVEMNFEFVNISYSVIEESYVTIQGVIPIYNNKNLNLRIYDSSGVQLPYSFIRDTFNEKVLKIGAPNMSPGKLNTFRLTFDWPYPIEIDGRRRWYSVPLYCFTSQLKLNIWLPKKFKPNKIEVRKEEPYPLIGEETVEEISPILEEENYVIRWSRNVSDAERIYKIYFDTRM